MCDCKKSKQEQIDELKAEVKKLQETLNMHCACHYPYSYLYYQPYTITYPNTINHPMTYSLLLGD